MLFRIAQAAFRSAPGAFLSCLRLWFHAGLIQEEHDHFLKRDAPGVDAAMDSWLRLIPICHPRLYGEGHHFAGVSILDADRLSTHNDRKPVATIGVPWKRFAWLQNVTPDNEVTSFSNRFGFHRSFL